MKALTSNIVRILMAACTLSPTPVPAKQAQARIVDPVVLNSVRYSAKGDGRDQYVVASDVRNGRLLWKVKVFHNSIDPSMEEDVQWVFIQQLKLGAGTIFVKDEKLRCYAIDLTRKVVKGVSCAGTF